MKMMAGANFLNKLNAILQLTRPVNVLITFLSVLVAAGIAGPLEPASAVLLAGFSAGLIMAAGNTMNDYYDVEIDLVNKPRRPLPAGKVNRETALIAALSEFFIGIILSAMASRSMFLIALSVSALIYLYAARLKRTILWGNFVVSLSAAAVFIYGGMAVRHPGEALFPAILAFFFHLGREIIKDMEDVEGDRRGNATTFPIRYGFPASIKLVQVIFSMLIGMTILPYWMGWYGNIYFIIVTAGVHTVLLYVMFSVRQHTPPKRLTFFSNLLKADMLVGLLAIYFR
jgi:geranylgeranylglycerol-phosphate geranylgeranyltransferase